MNHSFIGAIQIGQSDRTFHSANIYSICVVASLDPARDTKDYAKEVLGSLDQLGVVPKDSQTIDVTRLAYISRSHSSSYCTAVQRASRSRIKIYVVEAIGQSMSEEFELWKTALARDTAPH